MSAASPTKLEALVAEAQRVLSICNACRYCEGFCAVFPALQRRLEFPEADVHYLASLCHNCGSCLYACQYAPPHEFALDFPRTLAQVRGETYRRFAWPAPFARLFDSNGLVVSLATAAGIAALFVLIALVSDPAKLLRAHSDAQGSFYAVLPHGPMAGFFGVVSVFVLAALVVSCTRFWRGMGVERLAAGQAATAVAALRDAFTLKYLDGGGDGCTYPGERPASSRRLFHHLTFYGFLLCFAATCVATVYHYAFAWPAPYPIASLPVQLGIWGGVGLLIGPAGLMWLRRRSDPELSDAAQAGMNAGFLALLFLTSLTGLALLFVRETRAMGVLLAVHLGVVLALFVTLPYGKFVHAIYRFAALVRFHVERGRPPPQLGPE
jgi:citrate/tricarballylate utilization protein